MKRPAHLSRHHFIILLIVFVVGIALRLVNIGAPLLGPHSYRQADTAGIARNFHVDGIDLGRPKVDDRGTGTGVLGETEMPLFNGVIALAYGVTGPELWVARSLAGLGSIVTFFSLFLLVRRWTGNDRAALISSCLWFLLPYNIYFSMAIMPESWMLGGMTLGLLLFDVWAEKPRRWWAFISAAVVVALTGLVKVPALHTGLFMGVVLWWRQPSLKTWVRLLPALILFALVTLVPNILWVVHSTRVGQEDGATVMGLSGKLGDFTPLFRWDFYNKVIFQHLFEKLLTWAGLPLVLAGSLVAWKAGGGARLIFAWCAAVLVLFFVSLGPLEPHEYYKLPLVLPLCIFMGMAIDAGLSCTHDRGRQIITIGLTLALAVLAFSRLPRIWRQQVPGYTTEYAMGEAFSQHTEPGDLVISVDPGDSGDMTVLYLADRKGWIIPAGDIDPEGGFETFFDQGAAVVGCRRDLFARAGLEDWLERLLQNHDVLVDDGNVVLVARGNSSGLMPD